MTVTYEQITTNTLASAVSSVTLSSIPTTWTDLRLVISVNGTTSGDCDLQFNGDTGANYFNEAAYNGSNTLNIGSSTESYIRVTMFNGLPTDSNMQALGIYDIINYKNTSWHKTVHVSWANKRNTTSGTGDVMMNFGSWRSTSAINSITIKSATTFQVGSTFTLFGIKAAA